MKLESVLLALIRALTLNYPFIRGRSRLTNLLSKKFPIKRGAVVSFDGDLRIALAQNQFVSSQIFWFGIFEPIEAREFKSVLAPGMVVIDVGGNIGQYTLLAAKRVEQRGHVYTFEPASENFEMIKQNLTLNGVTDRVSLNRTALTSKVGTTHLIKPGDGGSNWLSPEGNESLGMEIEDVECTTLDHFVGRERIEKLDLIKIDVEGADYEVLKGATETIKRFGPILFIECAERALKRFGANPKMMLDYLLQLGYSPFVFTRSGLAPLTSDTNISNTNLFFRKQ